MLKNDKWINDQAQRYGLISPYCSSLIRAVSADVVDRSGCRKVLSYGLSSYGYDIRLSPKQFKIFNHVPGAVVDPKNFNVNFLTDSELHRDESGEYFILPAHTYALGVAMECLNIPRNITVLCIGKSTYARCGIIANLTPAEPQWRGHLTLELSNSSSSDCRIYANEGIVQLLFLESDPCHISYDNRRGKYQDQPEAVVTAKV